jgi:sugar O-acyltransferase (sialic acid O-acetyltransferase NeuD family)
MTNKKLIIIGAGSVGKFIAYNNYNFIQTYEIIGFLDDDVAKHNTIIAGIPVLGSVDRLTEFANSGIALVFGIAFPNLKKHLFAKYQNLDFEFPSFISKNAWISNEVTIGKGTILYPGISINYESCIGDFVVINMNCAVGHNCSIDSFSSLSPGVNLGGNTILGDSVEMGIGSCTLQGISIANSSKIGGQAMVTKDVTVTSTLTGIPAKPIGL